MESAKVGFIGFGLIAGSIAHALKESGKKYTIVATSRHLEPVYLANRDGIVDIVAESIGNGFYDCDLILLCTPVITITEYLKKLKGKIKPSCIISDVGSVKTIIHNSVKELDMEANFVGGHPMAGSEKTGYEHSSSSIIARAKYIITPSSQSTKEQIDFMTEFAKDINMQPVIMSYEVHDKTVAAISHLPHLLSTALVDIVSKNEDENDYMKLLAAGCFRDMSRVAASSPEMWEQISLSNSASICDLLNQYIDVLCEIRDNIKKQTPGYVASLFENSKKYREDYLNKNQK